MARNTLNTYTTRKARKAKALAQGRWQGVAQGLAVLVGFACLPYALPYADMAIAYMQANPLSALALPATIAALAAWLAS